MKMTSNIIIIMMFLFVGCHDVAFDYFGKSQSATPANKSYGELVKCKNDEQCGDNFSCLKEPDNLVGVCMQISPK